MLSFQWMRRKKKCGFCVNDFVAKTKKAQKEKKISNDKMSRDVIDGSNIIF
jgi:hypothetical protein